MRLCLLTVLSLLVTARAGWGASAAEYRRQAEQCVAQGAYSQAADYYRKEAAIYRGRGDVNGALVEEAKAERWTTRLTLYADQPRTPELAGRWDSHGKFEPPIGAYLGAWLDQDERVGGDPARFEQLISRQLSLLYDYAHYRQAFPAGWTEGLIRRGYAVQLAVEPNSLDEIQDDQHLQDWARAAARCGQPIFLRFAGEMNGDWTPYHGDPAKYIQKWRLVHDVFARLAPNVAMMWCVSNFPQQYIDAYYPGDDYVDWVAVNCYHVYYHDNDRNQPAWFESTVELLDYVYNRYAGRKPMAIGEYGATHEDTVDHVRRADYAVAKLSQLLAALPRRYPRIKMVSFYDCNNLLHAAPGRQLNNYSLTDDPAVLAGFKRAIDTDWYLSRGLQPPATVPLPLTSGMKLSGTARLSVTVKTYDLYPTVVYKLDDTRVAARNDGGAYLCDLDTRSVKPGAHTVTAVVLDQKGREAARTSIPVQLAATPVPAPAPTPGPTANTPRAVPPAAPAPQPAPVVAPPARHWPSAETIGYGLLALLVVVWLLASVAG